VNVACRRCGEASPAEFRFCGHCGAPRGESPESGAAGRRQLTVMFCDLVAASSLSERLDPEDLHEVLNEYQSVGAAIIERHGGRIAQYLGDGLLAYFGHPLAHEDDAQRAVRAGLAILSETARIGARLQRRRGLRPALRIGVHSGLAVFGDVGMGGTRDMLAVGETPNIAARLQSLAEPNSLVISAATHKLVRGFFQGRSLGTQTLKGFSQPLEIYRVMAESDVSHRLEAGRLAPFVGRSREMEDLLHIWQAASRGAGKMVLLGGEPGIGKSRLLKSCADRIDGSFTRLRYYCSEQHKSSPLYPVIRQLESAAGLNRDDPPNLKLEKLELLLAASKPSAEETALLAELLSIPAAAGRYPLADMSPQRKRQKTFAALIRQVESLSERAPVLMLFEDLHWIDPTSLELIEAFATRIARLRAMLVCTFRPEFRWMPQRGAYAINMTLGRLGDEQRRALVEKIAGGAGMAERTVEEIARRSDGVPLFIEELTRAVLDGGAPAAAAPAAMEPGMAVPASLNSSLLARLDRLGAATKEVAQVGAAIGRQFYYRLLAAVTQKTERELTVALDALANAALVTCRGRPPEATYVFKHALVQDAAYATLLRGRRRELHAAIAKELELRHASDTASQELIAHHCTQAGLYREAARAWKAAARHSVATGSFAEAKSQLSTALSLLEQLPADAERDRQEVALQNDLGNVLIAQLGYTAPDTLGAFERARVLAASLNDPGQGLRALWGLGTALLVSGRLGAVLEMMREAAPLVEKNRHLDARLAFSVVQGSVLLDLGRLVEADSQLRGTLAMDVEPRRDRERAILYGQSPRITALGCLSIASLLLGNEERSREQSSQSLREAELLAHKPMLCLAHSMACRRHWLAGESAKLARHAAALARLADDQGTPLWLALAKVYQGWSLVAESKLDDAIALMYEGMDEYRATGANAATPLLFLALGRACARAGRVPEAFEFFDDAARGGTAGEEKWLEAEVLRERGETLLALQQLAAGEEALRRAATLARQQGAKLFEWRALARLGHLLLAQSRTTEAYDVLAPACAGEEPVPGDLAALFADLRSAQSSLRRGGS
jgi:class 3 adenylate cyclase